MLIGDGGGGSVIPGDPATIRAAARQLSTGASTLMTLRTTTQHGQSIVAPGSWVGPASEAFATTDTLAARGFASLSAGTGNAAHVLLTYASALEAAQRQAASAQQMESSALLAHSTALANLPSAAHAATQATNSADTAYAAASRRAGALLAAAQSEARIAARTAASALSGLTSDVNASTFQDVADRLGGAGTALALIGLEQQGWTWGRLAAAVKAVRNSDLDRLAKLDPKGWKDVEKVADDFGDGDMRALAAQLKFEGTTVDSALDGAADAAVPLSKIPGGLSGVMDVLGKAGMGLAVFGDVVTLTNSKSSGIDKGMAGANLGGVVVVEGGAELATALGATDAVAAAVPVVGEVVIAGTAIYFATEWTVQNWSSIKRWAGDAGHAVVHAVDWAGGEIKSVDAWELHTAATAVQTVGHAGSVVLDTAGNVTHTVAHDLGGVEHSVDSGLDDAGHALASLNPF